MTDSARRDMPPAAFEAAAPGVPSIAWARVRLAIVFGFMALCFLGGGASRLDALSLLYLRPAAIFCGALLLLVPGPTDWRRVRAPLLFLAALALVMIIQLIPLPPGLWTSLPGHDRFAEAASAAGLPQPWRPISISPDLTLNSLISLIVPATMLIAMGSIDTHRAERWLMIVLLAAIIGSAVLGIGQVSGGRGSSLFWYRVTNDGMPVGLFANRNHQAALLACAFPILAAWASARTEHPGGDLARRWLAGLMGALLIPLIVVTGSRSGVMLAVIGLATAAAIFLTAGPRRERSARNMLIALAPWVIGAGLLLVSFLLARASAIQRLFSDSITADQRIQDFDLFVTIARDFLPFGSGFGTFDPVFRIYEPYEHLRFEYLNHAHNDLMELAITSGLIGLALLLVFVLWWAKKSFLIFRAEGRSSGGSLRIVGSSVVLILMLASIFDYPLRTPILMMVLAIAATWLGSGGIPRQSAGRRVR